MKKTMFLVFVIMMMVTQSIGVVNAAPEIPQEGDVILCNKNDRMLGPNAAFDKWTRLTAQQAEDLWNSWLNNRSFKGIEAEICAGAVDVGDNPDHPDHPDHGASHAGVIPGMNVVNGIAFNRAGFMPAGLNRIGGIPAGMTIIDGKVINNAGKDPWGLNKDAVENETASEIAANETADSAVAADVVVATAGKSNHIPAGLVDKVKKIK